MTTATQQPNRAAHCFAHNHMTMRQYGLWTRIRELQSKFGFVYFDADDLSAGFDSTSRDVIYDDCTALLNAGWFQLLAPRKRKKDGTWEARKLTALSHKEWSGEYPDKCLMPRESHSANSDWNHSANSDAPVGNQRLTSRQIAIDHSANSDAPVAPRRQRLGSRADMVQIKPDSKADMVQTREPRSLDTDFSLEKGSVSLDMKQAVAPDCLGTRILAAQQKLTEYENAAVNSQQVMGDDCGWNRCAEDQRRVIARLQQEMEVKQ